MFKAKRDRALTLEYPPLVVSAAVERAFVMLGAQLLSRSPDGLSSSARTSPTLKSWGEQLTIIIQPIAPSSCKLVVSSEAGQLYDWGKNEQNLQEFEQALMQVLATSMPSVAKQPPPTERIPDPGFSVTVPRRGVPNSTATSDASPRTQPSRRVFISYRRSDSGMIVGRIADRLIRDFGEGSVFKDIDNIPFGVDFVEYLDREVQKCTMLFAVIGRQWLQPELDGRRRLDDPNDFVRIEIGSALRRQIPVVPLLVDGGSMPRVEDLPDDLKPLARRNGIEVRHDPDFHNDMTRLLSRLG